MRRLKKNIYLGLCGAIFGVLAILRYTTSLSGLREHRPEPAVADSIATASATASLLEPETAPEPEAPEPSASKPEATPTPKPEVTPAPKPKRRSHSGIPHPIRSVSSYEKAFPDAQEVQIVAARKWGVKPVLSREQAEHRKSELVYVGSNPFFQVDPAMHSSIPYLVPRASVLLQRIGRNLMDSLYVKGVPLHKIIVTSVLRTEDDVARLMRRNGNANEQSCHRFATTFDIAYNRYVTVSPPDGPQRRAVQNDTLKWVLSEVLRDLRQEQQCYIKHEIKQGCFHITVR